MKTRQLAALFFLAISFGTSAQERPLDVFDSILVELRERDAGVFEVVPELESKEFLRRNASLMGEYFNLRADSSYALINLSIRNAGIAADGPEKLLASWRANGRGHCKLARAELKLSPEKGLECLNRHEARFGQEAADLSL